MSLYHKSIKLLEFGALKFLRHGAEAKTFRGSHFSFRPKYILNIILLFNLTSAVPVGNMYSYRKVGG